MIERFLIILILAAIGAGAYSALKYFHMRRLGKIHGENQPMLLYFRSENCAPCVTQAHYVEQLAHKWPGDLTIQKIDTDTEPDKARQYGVFTLPTTILVDKMGEVRQVNYGLTNSNKLAQQLHSL
jgi:thioredoxin-like negative regulator of GroEL